MEKKISVFDSFSSVKDTLVKAKDTTVSKASTALDANGDGTIDIQDVIVFPRLLTDYVVESYTVEQIKMSEEF